MMPTAKPVSDKVIGVMILAGGQGKRMGGLDKGWCLFQQRPMIERVLNSLQQQAVVIESQQDIKVQFFISANRNLEAYQALSYPVVSDLREGFCGPLAGIEAVMQTQEISTITRWITYPVDSPCVPEDYLERMLSLSPKQIGVWCANDRQHFVNLSIPQSLLSSLSQYLNADKRSVKGWLTSFQAEHSTDVLSYQVIEVASTFEGEVPEFLNLNSPSQQDGLFLPS